MTNEAAWRRRVAEWRKSGLTAAEFSQGQGYAPATLRWWSSRLGRSEGASTLSALPMVRLVAQPVPAMESRAGVVVEFAGARVSVESGFDQATLAAVLDVLASRSGERR